MASKPPRKGSQAAKKVAAGVKNIWEYAKRDFTDNGPQVKRELMDMLDYARNKTQLLKRPTIPGPSEISTQLERAVNMDVGGELLTHYKEHWSAIHGTIQLSGEEAARIDGEIALVCNSLAQSHAIIQRCHDEFSRLPDTIKAVEEVQNKVNTLGELLQQMEESITEYDRVKSQLECERKQHSIRLQYEKHCVEGDGKIEQLKNILAQERKETADHKKWLAEKKLEERQKTFQGIFNEQMAEYREKGSIERPLLGEERERAGSSLEDVTLEDKDGTTSLNEFLSDVVLDDKEKEATPEPADTEKVDKEQDEPCDEDKD